MQRTHISLSDRQKEIIPIMMKKIGVTSQAELIRRILDREIEKFLVDNSVELLDKVIS